MTLTHHRLRRPTTTLALVALVAVLVLAVAPVAFADDWAREHAATFALDPAIRTAIEARAASPAVASAPPATSVLRAAENGFAWGDALIGAAVAVAGMCVALVCVSLVRHDGRLRSA